MNKTNNKTLIEKIREFITQNMVPLIFLIICLLGSYMSGSSAPTILSDLVNRFARNGILVLSLILPVITGMGLNFGIVLGAMCGQAGIIVVRIWGVTGILAILIAMIIAALASVLCGQLAGRLLNRTKGQEMITSMILGFFANGIYQFIFLFVVGGIIKVQSDIILSGGIGINSNIDLTFMQNALDNLQVFGMDTRVDMFTAMIFFGIVLTVFFALRCLIRKSCDRRELWKLGAALALALLGAVGGNVSALAQFKILVKVPIPTFMLIFLVCLLTNAFLKTKIGHDMRAVGNDRKVAGAAGINVNKTRITAVTISTVMAGIGQIVYYQNLGIMDTYYGHERIGTYCVAAILIGGASVKKANISQALVGTLLFHLLFNVSPLAAQNLFDNSMVGGYFRMAICYGIIAISLILHAWRSRVEEGKLRAEMR